jgi:hypothetical protein
MFEGVLLCDHAQLSIRMAELPCYSNGLRILKIRVEREQDEWSAVSKVHFMDFMLDAHLN